MSEIAQTTEELPGLSLSEDLNKGGLICKNVRIYKSRTSIRLEKAMWNALDEIVQAENCSLHNLCGVINDYKGKDTSFTAALRSFLIKYYQDPGKVAPHIAIAHQRKDG